MGGSSTSMALMSRLARGTTVLGPLETLLLWLKGWGGGHGDLCHL